MRREAEIVAHSSTPVTIAALLESYYSHIHPSLRGAARRTVHAHLLKLDDEKRVVTIDGGETWLSVENTQT